MSILYVYMYIISLKKNKDMHTQEKGGAKESFWSDNVLIDISLLEYIHVIGCIIMTNTQTNV